MNVEGKYCWAITHRAERSCWCRSCSIVLEFVFYLTPFYTHISDYMCTKFRFARKWACFRPSRT